MTGTYKINGTDLLLQGTEGRWLPREVLGITGEGKPIYPSSHQFELRFNLSSQEELYQIQNLFDTLGLTGTCVVDLPTFDSQTFGFTSYSGCSIYEVERGAYFTEHTLDEVWLIDRIIV